MVSLPSPAWTAMGARVASTRRASAWSARLMRINLADQADALLVEATLAPIAVQAGDGNDTIDVGKPTGGALGAVQAAVTVDGQAGSDALRVNDADSAAHTFVVTATQVASGAAGVVYAGVE